MDYIVAEIGAQVAERFPSFGESGRLASSWTGVYDVTPDWNPVLGRVPGLQGLVVGYRLLGPRLQAVAGVGRVLAQDRARPAHRRVAGPVCDRPLRARRAAGGALRAGRGVVGGAAGGVGEPAAARAKGRAMLGSGPGKAFAQAGNPAARAGSQGVQYTPNTV
jgi:hypothetical protein